MDTTIDPNPATWTSLTDGQLEIEADRIMQLPKLPAAVREACGWVQGSRMGLRRDMQHLVALAQANGVRT